MAFTEEDYWRNIFNQHEIGLTNQLNYLTELMTKPHMLLKPYLSIDGNQWCALYGANLQDGVAGFGDSPELAMTDFDKSWIEKLDRSQIRK